MNFKGKLSPFTKHGKVNFEKLKVKFYTYFIQNTYVQLAYIRTQCKFANAKSLYEILHYSQHDEHLNGLYIIKRETDTSESHISAYGNVQKDLLIRTLSFCIRNETVETHETRFDPRNSNTSLLVKFLYLCRLRVYADAAAALAQPAVQKICDGARLSAHDASHTKGLP